jgi:plastocyanin domain-containing protein
MRLAAALAAAAAVLLAATASAADPKPAAKASRSVAVTVTEDGWVPDKIPVKAGETVDLVITRKTDRTCATEIVIKDLGVNVPLPLNKAVTVTVTPKKAGQVKYACGMDMISGFLVVQ